jgi:DNA-binding GntR family transcriptional regulator
MYGLEPVNQETTAGVIAAQLRARIMDGTFAPGSQLAEVKLASQLRVSRGPVREALQRLVQEGLLENRRNRGMFVVDLDDDEVADVYLARRVIEREAAEKLMRRPDKEEVFARLEALVGTMASAAAKGEWENLVEADLLFHEVLVSSSGSKRLQRMFDTLLIETRMCLMRLKFAYPVHERLVHEHRELLSVMRKGDKQEALDLIDAHLERAVKDLAVAGTPRTVSG